MAHNYNIFDTLESMENKLYRFKVGKLIRDKIISMSLTDGIENSYYKMDDQEFYNELNKKLLEEASEVINAKNKLELTEELADLLEVFLTIAKFNNIKFDDIEATRKIKLAEKGGFNSKIFIESISMSGSNPKLSYYLAMTDKYPPIK